MSKTKNSAIPKTFPSIYIYMYFKVNYHELIPIKWTVMNLNHENSFLNLLELKGLIKQNKWVKQKCLLRKYNT